MVALLVLLALAASWASDVLLAPDKDLLIDEQPPAGQSEATTE